LNFTKLVKKSHCGGGCVSIFFLCPNCPSPWCETNKCREFSKKYLFFLFIFTDTAYLLISGMLVCACVCRVCVCACECVCVCVCVFVRERLRESEWVSLCRSVCSVLIWVIISINILGVQHSLLPFSFPSFFINWWTKVLKRFSVIEIFFLLHLTMSQFFHIWGVYNIDILPYFKMFVMLAKHCLKFCYILTFLDIYVLKTDI